MTPSRTRAILNVLARGGEDELERGIVKVFGASTIAQCSATYEAVGAGERASIDEVVERVTANANAAFLGSVADEEARLENLPAPAAGDQSWIPAEEHFAWPPEPGVGSGGMQTYKIRRPLVSLGRSYWADDPAGAPLFRIAGRIGFPRRFSIKDTGGNRLYFVREKVWVLAPTFVIRRDGAEAAVVRRTTTSDAREDKFEITLQSAQPLHASGKLWVDDGVQIFRGAARVGVIRREQNVVREIFWATLSRAMDQALLLAIAMSIAESDPDRGNMP